MQKQARCGQLHRAATARPAAGPCAAGVDQMLSIQHMHALRRPPAGLPPAADGQLRVADARRRVAPQKRADGAAPGGERQPAAGGRDGYTDASAVPPNASSTGRLMLSPPLPCPALPARSASTCGCCTTRPSRAPPARPGCSCCWPTAASWRCWTACWRWVAGAWLCPLVACDGRHPAVPSLGGLRRARTMGPHMVAAGTRLHARCHGGGRRAAALPLSLGTPQKLKAGGHRVLIYSQFLLMLSERLGGGWVAGRRPAQHALRAGCARIAMPAAPLPPTSPPLPLLDPPPPAPPASDVLEWYAAARGPTYLRLDGSVGEPLPGGAGARRRAQPRLGQGPGRPPAAPPCRRLPHAAGSRHA